MSNWRCGSETCKTCASVGLEELRRKMVDAHQTWLALAGFPFEQDARRDFEKAARAYVELRASCEYDGPPLELLREGRFDQIDMPGSPVASPRPRPLSATAKAARAPQSPESLVEARSERVHVQKSRLIAAVPIKLNQMAEPTIDVGRAKL